jgi:uncharacterized protein YgiM (DUF1202 family)
MKIISFVAVLSAAIGIAGIGLSACGPKTAPAIGQATVNAQHASLRTKNSATSRTIQVMQPGDKVEILERVDRWYRVRLGDVEGWMEVSTLRTDTMEKQLQEALDAARNQQVHNTGVLGQDGNLRVEPGRSTSVLRRLPARTKVEILERKTLPREPNGNDAWLKVRTGPMEVGWLLSTFVEFDVPDAISRYTEDRIYATVKTVHQIEDPLAGTIQWYAVGERRPGLDPNLDFDGVRIFTWNAGKQRYETAFRKGGIRGVYPLEVGQEAGKPTFRVHELAADGTTRTSTDYMMYGVVVRPVKKTGD